MAAGARGLSADARIYLEWICDDASRAKNFFLNDTATTEIYTLSLHDALPICFRPAPRPADASPHRRTTRGGCIPRRFRGRCRSEEHTSELQSRENLVCRL